jgi:acetyl-CoA C-acetyltransferase
MDAIHIVAAKRSPIGKFGGGLKGVPPADLATQVAEAAVPVHLREHLGEVILGQVLQAGSGMNVARQTALRMGVPDAVPAYTVNMACGSSLKAVALAAAALSENSAPLVLAGGVENMSAAPYLLNDTRWGKKLGACSALDSIQCDGLTDPFLNIGMGETAERIAETLQISRGEQDAFAIESQNRAHRYGGTFSREMVAISHGRLRCETDEHPRPHSSKEELSKLKPAFRPEGTVTAGNASGINDGAAMVLLAKDGALAHLGLESRARIAAYSVVGCDPATMGLGPVKAIREVLARTGWEMDQVDAFEINEAFAAQVLGCCRQLDLDPSRVNLRGGAIALGHPIGASGARVLVTLLHTMEDLGLNRGVASLCIGGGMGIAMALER